MWGTGQVAADGFLGCWMRLGRERLQLPPCPSAKKKQAQVSLFPHCGGWDLGGGVPASPVSRAESQQGMWAGAGRQQHPSSKVTLSFPVLPVHLTRGYRARWGEGTQWHPGDTLSLALQSPKGD